MNPLLNAAAAEGILFFGRMSASISHELKNTLSIMNESAGLMEDLARLTRTGQTLEPERVVKLSGAIKRQIKRTDDIIRNMNRFAHSVDDSVQQIALSDFLNFVLVISRRLLEVQGVSVHLAPPETSIQLRTHPFYLHLMIWRMIEHGMAVMGGAGTLDLIFQADLTTVTVILAGLNSVDRQPPARDFPSDADSTLLDLLNARLVPEYESGQIRLLLPVRLEN